MLKKIALYSAILLFGIWLGHLIVFTNLVGFLKTQPNEAKHAPLITVLTGSHGRIKHGFDILKKGQGDKIFISGIGRDVTLQEIINAQNVELTFDPGKVVLDYGSRNTKANASSIKKWCDQYGITHIRLVTSRLHMPRSVLWLQRLAPEINISASPVPNRRGFTFKHAFKEFHKWMFATWHLG